jgi:hypothetical protein
MQDGLCYRISRYAILATLLLPGACDKKAAEGTPSTSPTPSAPTPGAGSSNRATGAASSAEDKSNEQDEPAEPSRVVAQADASVGQELFDIGPAGPATAHASGVVLVSRDDNLHLARYSKAPNGKTTFSRVQKESDRFAPYGRGPALLDGFAYWISKGRLVRRRLEGTSELEVLAKDARDGTRVSAARTTKGPRAAAYIARSSPPGSIVARLWVEKFGSITLSPEAAAANSVSLVAVGSELVALSLEGRTSMTPVHGIEITFDAGKPKLGSDVVLWVGSSAQPLTEITAIAHGRQVWGFAAMERDITRFGLARLHVGNTLDMNTRVTWRQYQNGMDPAPVAATELCGNPSVVYARPSSSRPRSPQELELAVIGPKGLGSYLPLVNARAFSDVSAVALQGAALIAYVADHRTWALVRACQ